MFSTCDPHGPSLSLMSCHSVQQNVNPLYFFPEEFFRFLLFRVGIATELLPIFHPCGTAEFKSFPPSQLCISWGTPQAGSKPICPSQTA